MGRRQKTQSFTLQVGSSVYYENELHTVIRILNLTSVLVEHVDNGDIKKAQISDIELDSPTANKKPSFIDAFPEDEWKTAQNKLKTIRPLVHLSGRTKADVEKVAEEHGLHINTIYSWLRSYEADGVVTSLLPQKRSDIGTRKLTPEVEVIIAECIESEYLTKQKKSVPALHKAIKLQCRNAKLPIPHVNTIRNRVNDIPGQERTKSRLSAQQAHNALHMNEGEFPNADYPLAVVQIDHTPLDIIVVDDEYRLPLLRPWITLAICVHSRMVVGIYIALDPPSAVSVGACISHAIIPKEKWLIEHDVAGEWPCWGIPRTVHADNAKEFRGKMTQKACEIHGINLEWRPVARPHFGGHIERLLGTFAQQIHELPGTTFSNTTQREGYDSEKESAFTLKELETWFANKIQEYHHDFHTGINCSPISKYEAGILGSKTTKGIGLPERVKDEQLVRINFLPFEERTIQAYGAQIDNVFYYHDVLRAWIDARVRNNSRQKQKFIFRRDPRDISVVWFFDPELETYFPIPYRNTAFPAVSIWEFRAALKTLKSEGYKTIDEDIIFASIEKARQIENEAVKKTKQIRRAQQKRKSSQQKAITPKPKETALPSKPETEERPVASFNEPEDDFDNIQPFDEAEEIDHD